MDGWQPGLVLVCAYWVALAGLAVWVYGGMVWWVDGVNQEAKPQGVKMAQSRISINIHGQNVPDFGQLEQFLRATRPAWVLVMDNLGLCRAIKFALPETNVIYRAWGADGDDNDHKQYTPGQWVAQKLREIGDADVWCYTTNEPEFSDEVLRWHTEVMRLAAGAGLKLVVGNWGVGNPTDVDHDWGRAETMLRLLDIHRETMVLGLHEYACGVITSGFIGGNPAERGLIMPDTWPGDVAQVGALWHCGRFKFLERYCRNAGIKPPRVVITEHGFDDVSDIKDWTNTLQKTPTFGNSDGNIRGWKTLENQWNAWFGGRGWSPQRAYFEQLKYADQQVYRGSMVEGQLIFSWGHSSDIWAQFDVSSAIELQDWLTQYAAGQPEPAEPELPVPTPTLPVFPVDFEARAIPARLIGNNLRVRLAPSVTSAIVGLIPADGVTGEYIPADDLTDAEIILDEHGMVPGVWVPVSFSEIQGWVFNGLLTVEDILPSLFDRQLVEAMLDDLQAGVDELRRYFDGIAE